METKRVNSKLKEDMAFGQPLMIITTPDDDMKGNTDLMINKLSVAYRTRRFHSAKYGEISIRANRASGAETEMSKILNGKARAQLYIFEFVDCWIVCSVQVILACLLDDKRHYIKVNNDNITSACYIKISDIPHFKINRQ